MEALIKAAEALSLPCIDLVPAAPGDAVVAHWGGRRSDLPEKFPDFVTALKSQAHFLSIDQEVFDQLGLHCARPLALSMFTTADEDEDLRAPNVSSGRLSEVTFEDSIPLTARAGISTPPWEALLLYGGPPVEEWLAAHGLQRWEYAKAAYETLGAYLEFYHSRLPLLMDDPPWVRVGGWHAIWPEDDFYIPREMRLMVWTFKNAEPWYEVFLSPNRNYVIKSRIT